MFQNAVAIISGGASGLGAATARYLVERGARVLVADCGAHAREKFIKLEDEMFRTSGSGAGEGGEGNMGETSFNLKFAMTDVSNEGEVSAALDMAEEEFGEHVNVAVNCAGVAPAKKTLSQITTTDPSTGLTTVTHRLHSLTEFMNTLNINAMGTFNLSRLAADRMARRGLDEHGLRGVIVNTASVAAYEGQVGQVAYAASKGAVVGMTLPMARDLSPLGIRVMTVAPGLFMTPLLAGLPEKVRNELSQMVPCPDRLGKPAEFAQQVGDIIKNPYLNGSVIRIDGALRMPP